MPTFSSPDNILLPDTTDGPPDSVLLSAMGTSVQEAFDDTFHAHVQWKPVANTTARASYLAAFGTPTSANPCAVFRGDKAPGTEMEYTTNGTTWYTLGKVDTGWVAITPSTGTGTMRYRADGNWVTVEVDLSGTFASGAVNLSASGVIPAAYRPGVTARSASYMGASTDSTLYATTAGQIGVINSTGSSKSSCGGTLVWHAN